MISPEKMKLYLEIIIAISICLGGIYGTSLAVVNFILVPLIDKENKYTEYCLDEIMTDNQRLDALGRFEKYKVTGIYVPPKNKGGNDGPD